MAISSRLENQVCISLPVTIKTLQCCVSNPPALQLPDEYLYTEYTCWRTSSSQSKVIGGELVFARVQAEMR